MTDDKGQGLPGVTVVAKGTTNGTTTDADGRFVLTVTGDATLLISFVGYASQEVPVSGRAEYLPIPLNQINFSKGLYQQNPGW